MIIGLLAGGIACLLLLKILSHKQLLFLLAYFSATGVIITIPIIIRQIRIASQVIAAIRQRESPNAEVSVLEK